MELVMMKIGPKKALELLETNIDNNRKIKDNHVQTLVDDMETGNWDPNNGETIKIDQDGQLVDGQHRLTAIMQSKKSFTLPVMYGVSRQGFDTIDTGSQRTLADLLHMRGVASSTTIASGVLLLEGFYYGSFHKKSYSHKRLLNRWEDHQGINDFAGCGMAYKAIFRPSEAVFLNYILQGAKPMKANDFFHALKYGGLPENHPIHILREKLMKYRMKRDTGYMYVTKEHVIGSVFKCWNHVERGYSDRFEMLKVGESIEYPVGFKKICPDIEIGGIEK